jgi:glycerate 2-kinase
MGKSPSALRADALKIFREAVKAVDPEKVLSRHVSLRGNILRVAGKPYPLSRVERIFVVGTGKASAPMAANLEKILGPRIRGGWVNVKYGHGRALKRIHIHEAGHPLPDASGLEGAKAILRLFKDLTERDLVIFLISGGGSALLPLPVPGVTLEEKQVVTRLLLRCGATIQEINTLRKHLSLLKGGGLAKRAFPAALVSLILSDVIGDPLEVIASGPTVPDPSTFDDCVRILDKFDLWKDIPASAAEHLREGRKGNREETVKAGDPAFGRVQNVIVGNNLLAMKAARQKARQLGYRTLTLSSLIEGETREVAKVHAAIAKEVLLSGNPLSPPACLLSGGETTVTLKGQGKGGRNQEFSLAAALEIEGWKDLVLLSAGTDGTDGPTDAAGAFADGRTVIRGKEKGMDALVFLNENDSYSFFEKLGDLLITGPTGTNVMDLRILLTARGKD